MCVSRVLSVELIISFISKIQLSFGYANSSLIYWIPIYPFPTPLFYPSPPSIPHKHNSNVLIINSSNCIIVNVCRCKVYRIVVYIYTYMYIYIYAFQFEYILLYYLFCLFLSLLFLFIVFMIYSFFWMSYQSFTCLPYTVFPLKWTIRLYTIAQYPKQSCNEVLMCLLVIVSEEISAILSKKWNFVDIRTSYT